MRAHSYLATSRFGAVSVLLFGLSVGAFGVSAQDSDQRPQSPFANPQNLQVLPKDISEGDLRSTMRGFSFATGLRCSDCHVPKEGAPLPQWNFQSDEKRQKRVARDMLKMVGSINAAISKIDGVGGESASPVAVRCMTCHRGVEKPELIQDALNRYKESGDGVAAAAHYQELREMYFGSHSYDFSPFALAEYAESAGQEGKSDFAMELHRLNVALNAEDAGAHRSMGNTLMAMGDFSGAEAAYRKAVDLDPDNAFNRSLLQRASEASAGGS